MENCIFCGIAAGSIPCQKVYEDDLLLAFEDIHPMAPVHILVIPKTHIASAAELTEAHAALSGHLLVVASRIAKEKGIGDGFRLITNSGADAGQTVAHLHFHILGGQKLSVTLG